MIKPIYSFSITFIIIISTYLYLFGESKTIELIKAEHLSILALIPLFLCFIYLKRKLKEVEIIDFNKNATLSFKTTILIFLFCEVYDYYAQGGFLGMISQWFVYWVMGIFAILLFENINYYRNYRLFVR